MARPTSEWNADKPAKLARILVTEREADRLDPLPNRAKRHFLYRHHRNVPCGLLT